jgi:hypothetical protein
MFNRDERLADFNQDFVDRLSQPMGHSGFQAAYEYTKDKTGQP